MSRALFWTTLRLSQWAIVAWAAFLVLYGLLLILLFPFIQKTSGSLIDFMRSLPPGLLNSMGMTKATLDELFAQQGLTMDGWLATGYFNRWVVMVGIYAFLFGSGTVAREVERGTMELLLSHPVPRYALVTSKFIAFLAIAGGLVLCTVGGIAAGVFSLGAEVNLWRVFLATAQGSMAVITIAAYSLLLSCLFLDPRKAMALAGGVTAAQYILNLMGPAMGSFQWAQKLSLFYYFHPLEVIAHGEFALSSVLVYVGVTVACFAGALLVIQRKKAVV